MKKIYLAGLAATLVLLLLATGALVLLSSQRAAGGYEVRGRIAGFSNNARRVIVEHEAVPGYMPAMTMPFTAADSSALGGLDVGDAVAFRLHPGTDSTWISDIERLPDSAVVRHPAAATSPVRTLHSDQAPLQEGQRVPAFTLSRDQSGEAVSRSDYDGQTLLVTFIYTRCPLPDYCPLMSNRFAAIQDSLAERPAGDVELLSVSFDPENDTAEVLADYAARYTTDLSNWTFATGTEAEVRKMTGLFGVFTQQDDGQITHGLTTALIGPDGRVREIWRGNDWTTAEVLDDVRHVTGENAGT